MSENQQTAEDFIVDISQYSTEQISELIEETLLFSSSLSIALQSIENPCVSEIQTCIVIDKLRIALAGIDVWLHNNKYEKDNTITSNSDEL